MIQLRGNTKTVVVICAFAQYNAPGPAVHNRTQLPVLSQIGPAVSRLQKLFSSERYQSEGIEVLPPLQCESNFDLLAKLSEIGKTVQDRPRTNLILFWSGHGGLDVGSFRLATPDTYAPIKQVDGLGLDEISRHVGIAQVSTWTLFLDACYAGAGLKDVVTAVDRQNMAEAGVLRYSTAMFSSGPYERARDSVFLNTVIDVLQRGPSPAAQDFAQSQGGGIEFNPNNKLLSVSEVSDVITAEFEADPVRYRNVNPPLTVDANNRTFWIFPNPQFRKNQPSRLVEDAYRSIARATDLESHFFPKAIGIDSLETGWHFTGRVDATRAILKWMREAPTTPKDCLYVLVADGGTGKSALLGRMIALTDKDYRKKAKAQGWNEDADRNVGTVPDVDQFDAALNLRNLTAQTTADHLAEILKVSKCDSVEDFVKAARETCAKGGESAPCIVLDALDEAEDPGAIVHQVIRPLSRAGWKVLVATRASAQARGAGDLLATLGEATCYRLDQDTQSTQDIHDYALGRLMHEKALMAVARPAALLIADRAENKFLFARMATSSLLRNAANLRPENFDDFIAKDAAEVLDKDIAEFNRAFQRKFERRDAGATAMLTALAWAQGEGVPIRDDIWAAMAMAIGQITEPTASFEVQHILWLLREAGRYIQEAGDGEQAVYRLFHKSLVEHFQDRRTNEQKTQRVHEEQLSQALVERVRASGDWRYTNPYLVRHLAAHLAARPSQKGLNNLLLNFDWVQARLNQSGIQPLLKDYSYCDHAYPATARLHRTLSMVSHILSEHPEQLIPQMLGRIAPGVPDMRPLLDGQPSANFGLPPPTQEGLSLTARLMLQEPKLEIEQTGPDFIDRTLRLDGFLERARASIQGEIWVPELGGLEQAGPLVRILDGHEGWVESVTVSPDGKTIVSGGRDKSVRLWDSQTGAQLRSLEGHSGDVTGVVVSPDGKKIISGSVDKTVRVWDIQTGALQHTLEGHDGVICSVVVSPDGKTIVSGSWDKTLRVWDVQTRSTLCTIRGHEEGVSSVAVSPDSKTIVSGSGDETVRVWDAQTGTLLRTLRGHEERVNSVAVSPDGKAIISGSEDTTVQIWDAQTGAPLRTLRGHDRDVHSVAASPDGMTIVSGSGDDTVQVWDAQTGAPLRTFRGHDTDVSSVVVSPNSKTIVSGSWDKTVRVWDAQTGAPLHRLEGLETVVFSLAISPDGKTIVSGSRDKTVRVWDAQTGALLRTLRGHKKKVQCVVLSPDGKSIVSGSDDKTVRVWDAQTGTLLRTLVGHGEVQCVVVSLDGKTIVSGGSDDTVQVWDAQTGAPLRTLEGHQSSVTSVAVSPDSKTIVSGSLDSALRIWDAQTGALRCTLQGHDKGVYCVAVGADGKNVVSGSGDKTVRVWDVQTGALLRTLEGHDGLIVSVVVSPDSKTIVSGGQDKTVRVWDALNGSLMQRVDLDNTVRSIAISEIEGLPALVVASGKSIVRLGSRNCEMARAAPPPPPSR